MNITIGGLIAWMVITVYFIGLFSRGWQIAFGRETGQVLSWMASVAFGAVGTQILFWISWLRWAGLDWLAAAWPLFQGTWSAQVVGGLAFLALILGLHLGPYFLIVRALRLSPTQENLRSLLYFFLISGLRWTVPFFLNLAGLSNPFTEGLDDFAADVLAIMGSAVGLLSLILAGLIYEARRASRGQPIAPSWPGAIGALALGQFALSATGSLGMAFLTFGLAYVWLGARWNLLLRQSDKAARVLFWLLSDLPAVLVWLHTWSAWHVGWLAATSGIVALAVTASAMPALMTPLFPIVARQERLNVLRLTNKDGATALENDIRRLEAEALRRRTLRQLRPQQRQIAQADAARRRGDFKRAAALLEKVIRALEQVASLTVEQRSCLGQAYLARGKVKLAQGQAAGAAADVEKARAYVAPDEEATGGLAEYAAVHADAQERALGYCLEYVRIRRGQPADARAQKVRGYLESLCRIAEGAPEAQVQQAQGLARRVIEADPDLAWAHRTLGQGFLLRDQWSQAVAPLETARRLEPNHSAVHFYLGSTYHRLGRLAEARSAFEESLRLDPRQPKAAHALGLLLLETAPAEASADATILDQDVSTLAQSIYWLEQASSLDPRTARYPYDLARAYARRDDRARARAAAERALQLDASLTEAHRLLADLLYAEAQWKAAIPHYRLALTADSHDPAIRLNLGHCLVELGQYSEAVGLLAFLASVTPQALFHLGRARLGLREYAGAARDLQAFIDRTSATAAACYHLGCAQAWLGVTENPAALSEAARWFERAAELDHSMWRAQLQLGHVRLRQEQFQEAIRHYRAAMRHPEAELDAGLALARACLAGDQLPEAREVLGQLEMRYPGDRRVHHVLGLAAELQQDLAAAEKAYRRAEAHGSLGAILYLQGKTTEAVQSLNRARSANEDSDRVLYYSGLSQSASADYRGALADWELLAKRHPDDARLALNVTRAWYLLGGDYYREGEYEQAAAAWEHFYAVYHADDETRQALLQMYLLSAYQRLGTAQVARALHRARELGADPRTCDYLGGLSRLKAGDYDGGAAVLRGLVDGRPDDPQCHHNLGLALLLSGHGQAALEHLARAREIASGDLHVQSTWALAAGYARAGEWSKAADLIAGLS